MDFSNNDLPCILTYHAAKGTEFDNVFIPFANDAELPDRNAFYVACTRSSRALYISYSKKKTSYLDRINPDFVIEQVIKQERKVVENSSKKSQLLMIIIMMIGMMTMEVIMENMQERMLKI